MANPASPFYCDRPTLLSFSGGRTSARMLRGVIDAHGGTLPDHVHVGFANTGKEREPTLRFVADCAGHWVVRVRWLEYLDHRKRTPVAERFEEVGFNSASRNGEPFDRLIARKKALPNAMHRWCTEFLKVGTLFNFAESVGLGRPGDYVEMIGLRADEKKRIERLRHDARNEARLLSFPLSTAGIVKSDIFSFWSAQPFDLQLPRGLGNCDQCPFLGISDRISRAQLDPASVEWWAAHEIRRGHKFGRYHTFTELLGMAAQSSRLPLNEDVDAECGTWCPTIMGGVPLRESFGGKMKGGRAGASNAEPASSTDRGRIE